MSGLEKLINFTVNNLKVKNLDREKGLEAIFYIDFLLNQEKNPNEYNRLQHLKNQVINQIKLEDKTILK